MLLVCIRILDFDIFLSSFYPSKELGIGEMIEMFHYFMFYSENLEMMSGINIIQNKTIADSRICLYGLCFVFSFFIAAVKVGNEARSWFRIKSGVKQNCVLSPFIWIILMDLVLMSKENGMTHHQMKK